MTAFFQTLEKIKPLYDWVYKILMILCKLLLIADILITSWTVAGRYLPFIKSPNWGEEMVLTMMVYMAVLSASLMIRKGSHIRMTAFDKAFSPKALQFSDLLSDLLVLGLGVILLVYGIRLLASPLCRLGHYSSMPGVSKFWQYLPIAVAGASMIIFEEEQIVIHLKKFLAPEGKEDVER